MAIERSSSSSCSGPKRKYSSSRLKKQKAFFNARAASWMQLCYDSPQARRRQGYQREFQRLLAWAPIAKNDIILDVGCGPGVLVPYILRRLGPRGRLREVDYAEQMIEVNRRRHSDRRVSFYVADVQALPFAAQSCHGLFCFSCFPHFQNKLKALRSMALVLKPGGWLLLAHFDSPRTLNRHHAKAAGAVKQDRLPGAKAMRALFESCGLTIERQADEKGFYAFLARAPAAPV